MNISRRDFLKLSGASAAALGLVACSDAQEETAGSEAAHADAGALAVDMAAWSYDESQDAWYQIQIPYCTAPEAEDYEKLALYVPGAYLKGEDNGDGTYTCTVDRSASVGSYTAATAPFVMPVNTAGYSSQKAATSADASGVADYLAAGLVYVHAGCRGRWEGDEDYPAGAPWGVTDLKAAIRWLRVNADALPGDAQKVFTFGHSGGGAQSALAGATGDSPLYDPYLQRIGAAEDVSDAITGAMCWCPITSLAEADAAYEWLMGQYASSDTRAEGTATKLISDDLAAAFADHVNELGLVDAEGAALTLDEGSEGIFCGGTYYEHVLAQIECSLNNFLADTEFPWSPSSSQMADGGFGGAGGGAPSGNMPSGDGAPSGAPSGGAPSGEAPSGDPGGGEAPSGDAPSGVPSGGLSDGVAMAGASDSAEASASYETAADYIAALNEDEEWIAYDEATNTATIASVGAFVRHCKQASKGVAAFDGLDRDQTENKVFGVTGQTTAHFDATLGELLDQNQDVYAQAEGWDESWPEAFAADLVLEDELGTDVVTRVAMYDPMWYLSGAYEGFGTSSVAPHWRIRTGIEQGDTSLTVEMNLALALAATEGVEDVDFETVWGQGHTTAERTGSSTANFIAWVGECVGA